MNVQLNLFEQPLDNPEAGILNALNDGRTKDRFVLDHKWQRGNYIVLTAKNKEHGLVFNIIDGFGKTPDNCSANWRNLHHVCQDLAEIA